MTEPKTRRSNGKAANTSAVEVGDGEGLRDHEGATDGGKWKLVTVTGTRQGAIKGACESPASSSLVLCPETNVLSSNSQGQILKASTFLYIVCWPETRMCKEKKTYLAKVGPVNIEYLLL